MSIISNKVRGLVSGREWYHQRFDGAPFYMYAVAEAELAKEKRKPKGTEANIRICFFENGKADWYLAMTDVRRGANVLIKLAKTDAKISAKFIKRWQKDEREFQDFFDNFNVEGLKFLSDDNLIKLFKHYHQLYYKRLTSSAIIDHFALGSDEYIASLLRKEVGKLKNESDFTKIFSVATAPVRPSFITQAEIELLEIAIKHPNDLKKIAHFQAKYFWLRNNFITAQVLNVAYFKKEVAFWLKSKINLVAKYKQLKNTPFLSAKNKTLLFKKYKFSPLLKNLLKISEEFTWWQDERKKSTFLNTYLGTNFLKEMSSRRNYNLVSVKYLLPSEVETMFLKCKPDEKVLRERMCVCAFVVWRGGYYVATGNDVIKLKKMMFPAKNKDLVGDIHGLSASVGRVVGPVRVIGSAREINKVKKGDILVSVMTRPDYIIGIKKAAALVTNEGGITCHAAIVAREMGIPCIIGTKIATQVLKDGDIVEVNANHGLVKILKKK